MKVKIRQDIWWAEDRNHNSSFYGHESKVAFCIVRYFATLQSISQECAHGDQNAWKQFFVRGFVHGRVKPDTPMYSEEEVSSTLPPTRSTLLRRTCCLLHSLQQRQSILGIVAFLNFQWSHDLLSMLLSASKTGLVPQDS